MLRLLPARPNQLTAGVFVRDTRSRSAISNQTQVGVARHELMMLLPSSMRSRPGHDVIHHALQFPMHQRVLRRVRLERMRVEAVRLVGGRVELRIQQTRWQNGVDGAVASIPAVPIRVVILIDAEVLVAVDAAEVRRVGRQQVVLHRRLCLRRVAQTSRSVLARVQVVVVVALILIVPRDYEIVGRPVRRDGAGVVGANRTGIHQRLMRHLSGGRRCADEVGQVLIQVGGRRVR